MIFTLGAMIGSVISALFMIGGYKYILYELKQSLENHAEDLENIKATRKNIGEVTLQCQKDLDALLKYREELEKSAIKLSEARMMLLRWLMEIENECTFR